MTHSEISAMAAIADALDPLDEDEVRRTLTWAIDKYMPATNPMTPEGSGHSLQIQHAYDAVEGGPNVSGPRDLAELFNQANPSSEREKALVTAFWISADDETRDFTSLEVNRALKNLGYPIGNITREFDRLMASNPRLIMQTGKSSSSKQARKSYRLTTAGRHHVQRLIDEHLAV